MAFCSNCGSKLGDMDQFCPACGAGQNQTFNPGQQPQVKHVNTLDIGKTMGEVVGIVKAMVFSPASIISSVSKGSYGQQSLILAAIMAIVQALMIMLLTRQVVGKMGVGMFFRVPYGQVFMYYLLTFIFITGSLFGGVYLVGRFVFKGDVRPMPALSIVVCAGVPFTVAMLLGLILGFISPSLGLAVLFLGGLMSVLCIYSGSKEGMGISDNKTAYTVPLAFIVMLLFVYVVLRILAK